MTTVTVKRTDGPRNAFIQSGSGLRFYTWQGRILPSVTSVRNMAGQPHALVSWKIARVCDRAVDELDTLIAMMARERKPRERVLEKNRRKEARAWLRAAHEEERDRAANRGTAVHKAAEDDVAPEDVTDYEDMYQDFDAGQDNCVRYVNSRRRRASSRLFSISLVAMACIDSSSRNVLPDSMNAGSTFS